MKTVAVAVAAGAAFAASAAPAAAASAASAASAAPAAAAAASAAASAAGSTATAGAPQALALRYSFDLAAGGPVDESGRAHALTTLSSHGGTVRAVGHGAGQALEFPSKCSGAGCPKVVLQAENSDDLNPGRAPFRYGATVLLAPNQTSAGQNVLQKGYSAAGGQYKLQIDGRAGRPSCALVGTGRSRIHLARSTDTVADGSWHTVECRRDARTLTILIDGVPQGSTAIPADMAVSNTAPLRIGGKGAYRDNDQFQGALDDVWVSKG
jgi:hypothetical protein